MRDRRPLAGAGLAALCALLVGCGGGGGPSIAPPAPSAASTTSSTTPSSTTPAGAPLTNTLPSVSASAGLPTPKASSYAGSGGNTALLVQWTQLATQLIGRAQEDQVGPNGPTRSQRISFMGTLQPNGQVSITLSGATVKGTLSGRKLTLMLPQSGGTIVQLNLTPGGPKDFQNAIAKLQQQASTSTTPGASTTPAATTPPPGPTSSSALQTQSDAANVKSDLASLHELADGFAAQTKAALNSDLSDVRSDLTQVGRDLRTTLADAGRGRDQVCIDAQNVRSDVQTLQGDVQTLDGDAQQAGSNASPVLDQITMLEQDQSALESDMRTDAKDVPAGTPDPASVQHAISDARRVADATYASIINAANSMQQQAQSEQGQASDACQAAG